MVAWSNLSTDGGKIVGIFSPHHRAKVLRLWLRCLHQMSLAVCTWGTQFSSRCKTYLSDSTEWTEDRRFGFLERIATQMLVEKHLAAEGIVASSLGRKELLKRAWKWKDETSGQIQQQMRRMGASADWSRERFTLDSSMNNAVTEAFCRLHEKGLIYRGQYMVNWSPALRTAVSDLEVEHSIEQAQLYYFKYNLDDGTDFIPVSTTRPETILGDTAVCVHPSDERYRKFVGQRVRVPMTSRTIPVVADEYVDPSFGSGALKVTPAHDWNDFEIAKRHGLPMINIMNEDASINEAGGQYAKLDRFECRRRIWEDMAATGLTLRSEAHQLRVPRSQRSGEVVEPLLSSQWFLKMGDAAKQAASAVANGDLTIVPARFEKTWFHWMGNIHDWCISRQLWWGHRIPVYYVRSVNDVSLVEPDVIVARSEQEAESIAFQRHGPKVILEQDRDVLDTWFSSGLWPFAALGWPDNTDDFRRFYPATLLETGYDILFFWVARMVTMGINLTGQLPFKTVYLHGLVRDGDGQKMSKTKGNVIDPIDTIDQYGCDALRFALVTGTTPGQDVPLSMEKVESSRNFVNKLWNVGKFVQGAAAAGTGHHAIDQIPLSELAVPEQYFLHRTHTLAQEMSAKLESLQVGEAGRLLYEFVWDGFADWYVEIAKCRLKGGVTTTDQRHSLAVLHHVWTVSLQLLHPFMPYLTEVLWQLQGLGTKSDSIMISEWPRFEGSPFLNAQLEAIEDFGRLQKLIKMVRNARSNHNVEPAKQIELVVQGSAHTLDVLRREADLLCYLSRSSKVTFTEASTLPSADFVHIVVDGELEVFLPLSCMVNPVKELARLDKQIRKTQQELVQLETRLSNLAYLSQAPERVVSESKARMEALRGELQNLQRAVAKTQKM